MNCFVPLLKNGQSKVDAAIVPFGQLGQEKTPPLIGADLKCLERSIANRSTLFSLTTVVGSVYHYLNSGNLEISPIKTRSRTLRLSDHFTDKQAAGFGRTSFTRNGHRRHHRNRINRGDILTDPHPNVEPEQYQLINCRTTEPADSIVTQPNAQSWQARYS